MTVSPFASEIYQELFADDEICALFTDQAHINSLIKVESALAETQGEIGIIPPEAAKHIVATLKDIRISGSELTTGTAKNGVVVPTLVKHLREAVGAESANYVHFAATSQDIIDTALILQVRDVLHIFENRIMSLVKTLAKLADDHRDTIMAARTRSQISTPTTFGLKAANWLAPFMRHNGRLQELKKRLLILSLGGASGTLATLTEEEALKLARAFKNKLGLGLSPLPWHNQRDNIAELASYCTLLTGSIAKIASDIILLSSSGIDEISIAGGGGSSTMPNKNNPVLAEAIIALHNSNAPNMAPAHIHNHERDGAAWQLEWLTIPKCLNTTGACLKHIIQLLASIQVNDDVMTSNIENTHGTILAEAASYMLSLHMDKSEAQKIVAQGCHKAIKNRIHLFDILEAELGLAISWKSAKAPKQHLGLSDHFIDRIISELN